MSRRRDRPPELEELDVPPPEDPLDPDDEDDDPEVEYFVDADPLDSVRTAVPNSLQSSQSSSSAPSTLVVVSDGRSAPHISHCGMSAHR